jgi:hypothetical protein
MLIDQKRVPFGWLSARGKASTELGAVSISRICPLDDGGTQKPYLNLLGLSL